MNRHVEMIFVGVLTATFVSAGVFFMLQGLPRVESDSFIFGALFSVISTIVFLVSFRRYRKLGEWQAKDFAWYKSANPGAWDGKRIACKDCGSKSIRVRGLMNKTFMREHLCAQCGTALYYSKEPR